MGRLPVFLTGSDLGRAFVAVVAGGSVLFKAKLSRGNFSGAWADDVLENKDQKDTAVQIPIRLMLKSTQGTVLTYVGQGGGVVFFQGKQKWHGQVCQMRLMRGWA